MNSLLKHASGVIEHPFPHVVIKNAFDDYQRLARRLPVKTIPYKANTFVCFLNTPSAVHGVSERNVTQLPRRYMNLYVQ